MEPPSEPRIRWWSRISPWWWGLMILVAIVVVLATQVPRIASAPRAKPTSTAPSTAPTLSGPVYSQALVAGHDFEATNLSAAVLMHLDLRGKDFQHANAVGTVFADSLLNGADFAHADLRGANLRGTCLRGAILTGADLAGADFTDADVTGATVTAAATSAAIGWNSTRIPRFACRSDYLVPDGIYLLGIDTITALVTSASPPRSVVFTTQPVVPESKVDLADVSKQRLQRWR